MYVSLDKDTFVKFGADDLVYIYNDLTKSNRIYTSAAVDFLKKMEYTPKSIDGIVCDLVKEFDASTSKEEIENDFLQFVSDLAKDKYVVISESDDQTLINKFNLRESNGTPSLEQMTIELTDRCNENCVHCYIPSVRRSQGNNVSLECLASLLSQFERMGGKRLTLTGGEILTYVHFNDLFDLLSEHPSLKVTFLSNLIAINDSIIAKLQKLNVDEIQVSLYSTTPSVHDSITRRKGSCILTKNAIRKLRAAGFRVKISCPIMKSNMRSALDMLKFAKEEEAEIVMNFFLSAREDFSKDNLVNRLDYDEAEFFLKDLAQYDPQYVKNMLLIHNHPEGKRFCLEDYINKGLCSGGRDSMCISSNGDAIICAGWNGLVAGNINNQTLKDIWYNSDVLTHIRGIKEGSFPECVRCTASDFCARCLFRNYVEKDGDMESFNKQFCQDAFLYKKVHIKSV